MYQSKNYSDLSVFVVPGLVVVDSFSVVVLVVSTLPSGLVGSGLVVSVVVLEDFSFCSPPHIASGSAKALQVQKARSAFLVILFISITPFPSWILKQKTDA
jgi:hypothetical protein